MVQKVTGKFGPLLGHSWAKKSIKNRLKTTLSLNFRNIRKLNSSLVFSCMFFTEKFVRMKIAKTAYQQEKRMKMTILGDRKTRTLYPRTLVRTRVHKKKEAFRRCSQKSEDFEIGFLCHNLQCNSAPAKNWSSELEFLRKLFCSRPNTATD